MKSKVILFGQVLRKEYLLYQRKTMDYGAVPVERTGIVGLLTRIIDKTERAYHLTGNGKCATVTDENLEDTLMDIANYANMALVELKYNKKEHRNLLDIITSTEKHNYGKMDRFGAWDKKGT